MTIQVACTNCGEEFRVRDEAAGKSFKCKSCGTTIRIPDSEPEDYEPDEPEDDEEFPERSERPQKKKKKRRSSGGNETLGPAIGLYIVGGLAFAYALFSLTVVIASKPEMPPNVDEAYRTGFLAAYYGVATIGPVYHAIILIGAFCLQTRRAYPMALFSCILASIPCCSPCVVLGMPFGIWGLVVLFNEDVKRTFA